MPVIELGQGQGQGLAAQALMAGIQQQGARRDAELQRAFQDKQLEFDREKNREDRAFNAQTRRDELQWRAMQIQQGQRSAQMSTFNGFVNKMLSAKAMFRSQGNAMEWFKESQRVSGQIEQQQTIIDSSSTGATRRVGQLVERAKTEGAEKVLSVTEATSLALGSSLGAKVDDAVARGNPALLSRTEALSAIKGLDAAIEALEGQQAMLVGGRKDETFLGGARRLAQEVAGLVGVGGEEETKRLKGQRRGARADIVSNFLVVLRTQRERLAKLTKYRAKGGLTDIEPWVATGKMIDEKMNPLLLQNEAAFFAEMRPLFMQIASNLFGEQRARELFSQMARTSAPQAPGLAGEAMMGGGR